VGRGESDLCPDFDVQLVEAAVLKLEKRTKLQTVV